MVKICIDPGHGGCDPGAVGPGGTREKDVTLAVSKLLAQYLAPIAEVKLLRTEDRSFGESTATDLRGRVALAEQFMADIYLSVHCNAAASPSARGMEAYTSPGQGKSDPIAEAIIRAWNKEFPGMAIRKDLKDGDSDKEANFYVLRKTSMPAVLIELAFISNPAEEKMLKDPAWQDRAARAIATGVANYLGKKLPAAVSAPVAGYPTVPVSVHGKLITGIIIENRTFVWINDIAAAYGNKTRWDPKERKVYVE